MWAKNPVTQPETVSVPLGVCVVLIPAGTSHASTGRPERDPGFVAVTVSESTFPLLSRDENVS